MLLLTPPQLAELDAERERATTKQARIAVAGIVGVIATITAGFLATWLQK